MLCPVNPRAAGTQEAAAVAAALGRQGAAAALARTHLGPPHSAEHKGTDVLLLPVPSPLLWATQMCEATKPLLLQAWETGAGGGACRAMPLCLSRVTGGSCWNSLDTIFLK